jgi:hypothetical protein
MLENFQEFKNFWCGKFVIKLGFKFVVILMKFPLIFVSRYKHLN